MNFPFSAFIVGLLLIDESKFKCIHISFVTNVRIYWWMGGSAQIRTLFGFVNPRNPYGLLDDPYPVLYSKIFWGPSREEGYKKVDLSHN